MFYQEGIYCYFKPARVDGDFVYDNKGNEYVCHDTDGPFSDCYVIKDNQTYIIVD